MTPLYLAVVPGRSGRNQLVLHAGVLQSDVKRTEFRIADVLVFKLRSVIRNESYSGAFVYGCPLV